MEGRDLLYERENIGYDYQYPEGGIKCKNYDICKEVLPGWWHECKASYICTNCDIAWGELEFMKTAEECAVCGEEDKKHVKFPAGCSHSFCVSCSKQIITVDESRYHLSKNPFGCPPCPNGCNNPVRGRQCNCEEYDTVVDKWEKDNPSQFEMWNDEEDESILMGEIEPGSVFGSNTCPLCRRDVIYNNWSIKT
jgi:hypothetical protein